MLPLHILFAVSVAVLWGGNFVAAKYSVSYFPGFFVSVLRFVAVSALLLPFVPRPTRKQIIAIIPLAGMSMLHFSLLFVALEQGLDVASCALIGQLGVPIACILGAIFLNDRIGLWRIGGIVIAFAGISVVAGTPNILAHMTAFYLALGSTFTWGVANVLVKKLHGISHMTLLAWVSVFSVPYIGVLSYIFEPNSIPLLYSPPWQPVVSLAYTVVCSTIMAYGFWYYLLNRYNVSQVAPFSLLTPVFGIGFAQFFFTEELTLQVILGGIMTILGVAIIVMRRPKTIPLGEAT
jgi:O-acetylserine/cysteine efflux transporter